VLPALLPDGRGLAYVIPGDTNTAGVYVTPQGASDSRLVVPNTSNVAFVPGAVVFARGQSLLAQRVDASTFAAVGDPVALANDVRLLGQPLRAAFSASADGHILVYLPNGAGGRLSVVDRTGREIADAAPTGAFNNPVFSRDDQRIAFQRTDQANGFRNIWIFDVARKGMTQVTNGKEGDSDPTWSPAGDQLAFSSVQGGRKHFYVIPSSGGEPREIMPPRPIRAGLDNWSHDGRFILYHDETNHLYALDVNRRQDPLLVTSTTGAAQPDQGAFSPTDDAVAFDTLDSGRSEVYVVPFPPKTGAAGPRWPVSTNGGSQPL
jgi:Tol biopolymer transport system component